MGLLFQSIDIEHSVARVLTDLAPDAFKVATRALDNCLTSLTSAHGLKCDRSSARPKIPRIFDTAEEPSTPPEGCGLDESKAPGSAGKDSFHFFCLCRPLVNLRRELGRSPSYRIHSIEITLLIGRNVSLLNDDTITGLMSVGRCFGRQGGN